MQIFSVKNIVDSYNVYRGAEGMLYRLSKQATLIVTIIRIVYVNILLLKQMHGNFFAVFLKFVC